MTYVYVCPVGHVMPAGDKHPPVQPCRYLIGSRMQCGRNARREVSKGS